MSPGCSQFLENLRLCLLWSTDAETMVNHGVILVICWGGNRAAAARKHISMNENASLGVTVMIYCKQTCCTSFPSSYLVKRNSVVKGLHNPALACMCFRYDCLSVSQSTVYGSVIFSTFPAWIIPVPPFNFLDGSVELHEGRAPSPDASYI